LFFTLNRRLCRPFLSFNHRQRSQSERFAANHFTIGGMKKQGRAIGLNMRPLSFLLAVPALGAFARADEPPNPHSFAGHHHLDARVSLTFNPSLLFDHLLFCLLLWPSGLPNLEMYSLL
jgi:hypothetical protein